MTWVNQAMSKTSATHTIISRTADAPFPGATRLLIALTLLINIVLLSIHLGLRLPTIDPHRRYQTTYGSSLPGTSVRARILIEHGVPILLLIALGIMLWRDDGRAAATLYAIAAFIAIPFLFARYFGSHLANYPASLSLHILIAFWLLACGLTAVVYMRRFRTFGRRSQIIIIEATTQSSSGSGG
jgi:hypothetical protein